MPLVRRPPPPVEPVPAAEDPGAGAAERRWAAARAAADAKDITLLAGALANEDDTRVREAIFTGLARIGTRESAAVLLDYLRSDDAGLRTGAIDALRAMPDAARIHLPALLADPDVDVRLLSCELARGLPASEAGRLLCDLLDRESDKNVCAAAIEVLAEVGDARALPSLRRCAERFAGDPFVVFSIKVATDSIGRP